VSTDCALRSHRWSPSGVVARPFLGVTSYVNGLDDLGHHQGGFLAERFYPSCSKLVTCRMSGRTWEYKDVRCYDMSHCSSPVID
jgi:hypothetical protein